MDEVETLDQALETFYTEADSGIRSLNRQLTLNRQWLRIQLYETDHGINPFAKPKRCSEPEPTPPENSASTMPLSELVMKGSNMLNKIMGSLKAQRDESYNMSDWEDEDAMKPEDFDPDNIESLGKPIPDWAYGDRLERAVRRQNMDDGDIIFQSMERRCNLRDCFQTNYFKYYENR